MYGDLGATKGLVANTHVYTNINNLAKKLYSASATPFKTKHNVRFMIKNNLLFFLEVNRCLTFFRLVPIYIQTSHMAIFVTIKNCHNSNSAWSLCLTVIVDRVCA